MTTATRSQAQAEGRQPVPTRVTEEGITGRYRPITTHQLAITWWLYGEGHITRRQLRVAFAAHEMAERRRYAPQEKGWRPLYGV